jgi:hypothetical protein
VSAAEKLAELRAERAEVAATRTREDVRELAESWLASALAKANGSARGYVLNGHVGRAEVQSVLAEYLLERGALIDFIVGKTEAVAGLTNRQRDAKLKKLDAAIAHAEAEALEQAKAEALRRVEEQFAPCPIKLVRVLGLLRAADGRTSPASLVERVMARSTGTQMHVFPARSAEGPLGGRRGRRDGR